MKLLKVFAMVLSLHIVLMTVFFLSPGCRSTPGSANSAPGAQGTRPVPVTSENWTNQPSSFGGESSLSNQNAAVRRGNYSTAPLTGPTPAERARSAPSRPGNPDDFLGGGASSTGSATLLAPFGRSGAGRMDAGAPGEPARYTVRAGDSLWRIARTLGTTVGKLGEANPGIKADALQPGDMINIPEDAMGRLVTFSDGGSGPVSSAAATSTYTVRSGDSLSAIAARNGTTIAALRRINNLTNDVIQIGQTLAIPGGAAGPAPGPAREARPSDAVTVTVKSGDTLGEIAQEFDVTVRDLMTVNNITDPRFVRVGQVLVIPGYQAIDTDAGAGASLVRPSAFQAGEAEIVLPTETIPAPSRAPGNLDDLIPEDVLEAPVVPIDEPVPQP